MAAEVVGHAYVVIRALTTKLANDISDGVKRGASDAGPDVDKAGTETGERYVKSAAKEIEAPGSKKRFARAVKEVLDGPDIKKETDRGGRSVGRRLGLRMAQSIAEGLGGDEGIGKRLSKGFDKVFDSLKKIQMPGGMISWVALLGLPALGGAAKAAMAIVNVLVAQLGYIATAAAGAGVGLVGMAGVALPALLPLMLALKAETEELEAFKEAAKDLIEPWKEVGRVTQRAVLPGLQDALKTLTKLAPSFEVFGKDLGTSVGNFVRFAAAILTSDKNLKSFNRILGYSREFFDAILRSALRLLDALIPLFEITAPYAVKFADALERMAERFRDFILAGAESGSLTETFDKWWDRLETISRTLANLGKVLWNVLKVGSDSAAPMFERLESLSAKWLEWTNSISGQNKLKEYFDNSVPVFNEVWGLIKDIFFLVAEPIAAGNNDNLIAFLQDLRERWLPALASIAQVMSDFGSDALTSFVETLGNLFQTLGENPQLAADILQLLAIKLIVFKEALELLDKVLQNDTGRKIIEALLPFVTVLAGIASIPGGPAMLKALAGGVKLLFGTVIKPVVVTALTALAGVLGLPVWATAAVVIAVLAATIGSAWVAFKYWEKIPEWLQPVLLILAPMILGFRQLKAVLDNWGDWGGMASAMWDNFVTALGPLPRLLEDVLGKIGEFAAGVVDWFKNLPKNIGQALSGLGSAISKIPGIIGRSLSGLAGAAASALGGFLAAIGSFLLSLPGRVLGFMGSIASSLWSALTDWIVNSVPVLLGRLAYWLSFIVTYMALLPVKLVLVMQQAAFALTEWVIEAIPGLLANLLSFADSVWSWVSDFVGSIPGRIVGAIAAIVGWIVQAVPRAAANLASFAGQVWSWASGFVAEIPGRIVGAVTGMVQWALDAIPRVAANLQSFANTVYTEIRSFITSIPGRVSGAIGSLISVGSEIVAAILRGIQSAWGSISSWVGDAIKNIGGGLISGAANAVGSLFGRSAPSGGGGVYDDTGGPMGRALAPAVQGAGNAMGRAAPDGFPALVFRGTPFDDTIGAGITQAITTGVGTLYGAGRSTITPFKGRGQTTTTAAEKGDTTLVKIENATFVHPTDVDTLLGAVRLAYRLQP